MTRFFAERDSWHFFLDPKSFFRSLADHTPSAAVNIVDDLLKIFFCISDIFDLLFSVDLPFDRDVRIVSDIMQFLYQRSEIDFSVEKVSFC